MSAKPPARPRRIGLFGGSFDPVHSGHLEVARRAQRAFALDRVAFVPAARPPHKPGRRLAPARDRVAMLERAIAGEPGWQVAELELGRAGPSYTYDTVAELPAALGEPADAEVFLILGTDNLPGLPGWHRALELLERVQPIVVPRAGWSAELFAQLEQRLPAELVAKLRRGLVRREPAPGASTDLRRGIAAGEDPEEIPPAVREYIRARGLYGGAR